MPKLTRTLAAVAGAAATGLLAEKAAARRVRRGSILRTMPGWSHPPTSAT